MEDNLFDFVEQLLDEVHQTYCRNQQQIYEFQVG
jgi:hypothetical protein